MTTTFEAAHAGPLSATPKQANPVRVIHVNLAKGFRGGERQTAALIKALDESASEQVLVCRKSSPIIAALGDVRCKIHCVRRARTSAFFCAKLAATHPVVVHAHEAKASVWAWIFKKVSGAPYVITRRIQKRPGNSFLTRSVYGSSSYVVPISDSVSATMSDYLKSIGSFDNLAPVVPDSVTLTANENKRKELRERHPGKFIVGHIGELSTEEKGQDLIVAAARSLQTSNSNLHFVLIGDGPDRPRLESMCAGLSNIEFLGFRSDIAELLSQLDAFVFPSRHEGLGSSLLDALQFEIPVIASRIPGITDVIRDRDNGLLVTPDDPDQLEAAITELYSNPSLRAQLREHSRPSLERFEPKLIAEAYRKLYDSALPSIAERRTL